MNANREREILQWLLLGLILATLLVLCSCKTTYVPVEVETVKREYVVSQLRDSVVVSDSVFIRDKGDTLFVERWHTLVKERVVTDTTVVSDTLREPVIITQEVRVKNPVNYWSVAIAITALLWLFLRTDFGKKWIRKLILKLK